MDNEKHRKTFLSYSRVNKEFAIKLAKELKAEGFDIWLDQLDIEPGKRWDDEVERALEECEIFMVMITPASSASDNVKDEIGYAIDSRKRILPILLENATLPLRLRRLQYVDFTSKGFNEGVESAKELLKKLIAQTTIQREEMSDKQREQVSQAIRASKGGVEEETDRLAMQKAEEERVAKEKAEVDRRVKEEAERLFEQKTEEERLTKAKAEADRKAKAETRRKAKEESDRLTTQKAEKERLAKEKEDEELAAKAKVEKERKAKEDSERLIAQKAEEERLAKQKAEDELAAKASVEKERKTKEEADRLAAQKAEADRLVKQKAEEERLAKAKADREAKAETERKAKEEVDRLPAQISQWSAVAWITLGWVIGFLVIAYDLKDYSYNRGYTNFTDTFLGAIGGAVIGLATAITLKRQHTISNWKSVLWVTLIAAISFSIAVVKGEQSYHFATNGAIYGAIGGLGIAFVLRNIHVISNWKSLVWITLFGAIGSAIGLGTMSTIFQGTGSSTIGGIIGGIIGGAISAFVLIWQIRKGVNTNMPAESARGKFEAVSTVTEQTTTGATGTNIRAKIDTWPQVWWKRGLLVTIVGAVLGFVVVSASQGGSVYSSDRTIIIVISIVLGVFGFIFFPHKTSYILTIVLSVIGFIIWYWFSVSQGNSYAIYVALWFGMGSGFILSAILSRILHAMKKI